MSALSRYLGQHIRRPTIVECLVAIVLIGILVALVLPGVKWASSGSIRVPVRVFVFDAASGKPVPDARIIVFPAPPVQSPTSLAQFRELYDPENVERRPVTMQGGTGEDGTAVIDVEFRTGANHERPVSYAHLRWHWVYVQAEGYGAVVVPVRHESLPVATVRLQKELPVSIGLVPM